MTTKENLERFALAANRDGLTFAQFWERHGADVAIAIPRDRYKSFYIRLMALITSGDQDGMTPIGGDDFAPWLDDKAAKPADVERTCGGKDCPPGSGSFLARFGTNG